MSYGLNAGAGPSISRSSSAASSHSSKSRLRNMKDTQIYGQASWLSSVVNLVNTIVGAGVLAMPLALSHMGIVLGTVVIIWAGLTAGFGLYLQTRCARYLERGTSSFFALSQITYPRASVIFDAAIAIKCFGVGVSYLIIIGDLMPGVVRGFNDHVAGDSFLLSRHFWITAFMIVVIPFSFLRRLDSLKYTSIVALVSIGYLVVLVVAHFAKGDTAKTRGTVRVFKPQGVAEVFASLPVMVFAYTCHQNMFSILNEMKDPAPSKTLGVVGASAGSAGLIYGLVAITGYLSFGDNVSGNVVGMYAPSVASTIGKAAIVVLVMFSYALQVHPCRASVDAVLNYRFTRSGAGSSSSSRRRTSSPSSGPLLRPSSSSSHTSNTNYSSPAPKVDSMSETRFALITTVIIILSYIVAMTVSSLATVLAYVGSTGSTSISFILPGLFYYKISDPDSPTQQRLHKAHDDDADFGRDPHTAGDEEDATMREMKESAWKKKLLRRLSLALAIYGLVVMITCLITNTFFITSAH